MICCVVSGCAVLEAASGSAVSPVDASVTAPPSVVSVPVKKVDVVVSHLSAYDMFRILVAETLAARGKVGAAATVYLDVATSRQDARMTQRAYDLATQAGDRQLLATATSANTQANPAFLESWQLQVVLKLRDNDLDGAMTAWQAFYAHSRAEQVAERDIFMSAATLGQEVISADTLIAFGDRVAQQYPSPFSVFMQVIFVANSERWQAAYDRLMPALEKYPDQAELAQLMGTLLTKQVYAPGMTWLSAYYDRHPDAVLVGEQYARALVSAKRLDEARVMFERLLKQQPDLPTVQMSLGLIELELSHPDKAEKWLRPLLNNQRLADMARYYLGQALNAQGNVAEALLMWQAVTSGDYALDALMWRAQVMMQSEQVVAANQLLMSYTPSSEDEQVRWVRAQVRLALLQKKPKDARRILDKAVQDMPTLIELWKDRANFRFDQGDVIGFEQDIRQALTLDAQDPDVLNALGYYLADSRKNLTEARALLDRANALSPGKHYITDSLGWLAYQEGKLVEAQRLLSQAYRLQNDGEVLRHWLTVLIAQGDRQQALSLAKQEGTRFPEDVELQKILKQLQSTP